MKEVLIIHGPNLNLLGQREPEIYGKETLEEINRAIETFAQKIGVKTSLHQSNSEAEIIELLHRHRTGISGVVLNPGAFSHTFTPYEGEGGIYRGWDCRDRSLRDLPELTNCRFALLTLAG